MAIVEATRELEPDRPPIGWDGRSLEQMLDVTLGLIDAARAA